MPSFSCAVWRVLLAAAVVAAAAAAALNSCFQSAGGPAMRGANVSSEAGSPRSAAALEVVAAAGWQEARNYLLQAVLQAGGAGDAATSGGVHLLQMRIGKSRWWGAVGEGPPCEVALNTLAPHWFSSRCAGLRRSLCRRCNRPCHWSREEKCANRKGDTESNGRFAHRCCTIAHSSRSWLRSNSGRPPGAQPFFEQFACSTPHHTALQQHTNDCVHQQATLAGPAATEQRHHQRRQSGGSGRAPAARLGGIVASGAGCSLQIKGEGLTPRRAPCS